MMSNNSNNFSVDGGIPRKNERYISHHALRAWCSVPYIFSGYTSIHWKIITVTVIP